MTTKVEHLIGKRVLCLSLPFSSLLLLKNAQIIIALYIQYTHTISYHKILVTAHKPRILYFEIWIQK